MPTWILSLDASTPATVVAVGRVDESAPRAEVVSIARANQTSERLTDHIHGCLTRAGITPAKLAYVACGVGPGTFTGTRVTVALAKGIALGLGVPVIPVSTLEAVALGLAPDDRAGGTCLALLDARRGEVYAAAFAPASPALPLQPVLEPCCAPLNDVLSRLPTPVNAVGTGVAPYEAELAALEGCALHPTEGLTAAGLWRATLTALAADRATTPAQLRVHYLRASYAEMGIHAPKKPMVKSPFV